MTAAQEAPVIRDLMDVAPLERVIDLVERGLLTHDEAYGAMVTQVVVARKRRIDEIRTPEEFATIGHMRGWCHDSRACAIC